MGWLMDCCWEVFGVSFWLLVWVRVLTAGIWRYWNRESLVTFFRWDPRLPTGSPNGPCRIRLVLWGVLLFWDRFHWNFRPFFSLTPFSDELFIYFLSFFFIVFCKLIFQSHPSSSKNEVFLDLLKAFVEFLDHDITYLRFFPSHLAGFVWSILWTVLFVDND